MIVAKDYKDLLRLIAADSRRRVGGNKDFARTMTQMFADRLPRRRRIGRRYRIERSNWGWRHKN